ncbi:unnamed protein product [Protopolystoma xenopodis]|uniref:Uncharacterized protein n=1 Tax=Protopolystoma xenopodis TaxID=117903 RepID=A0A448X9S5_9PLAT|nr:unnamed protein product [Protopolystoma xenopodis]
MPHTLLHHPQQSAGETLPVLLKQQAGPPGSEGQQQQSQLPISTSLQASRSDTGKLKTCPTSSKKQVPSVVAAGSEDASSKHSSATSSSGCKRQDCVNHVARAILLGEELATCQTHAHIGRASPGDQGVVAEMALADWRRRLDALRRLASILEKTSVDETILLPGDLPKVR